MRLTVSNQLRLSAALHLDTLWHCRLDAPYFCHGSGDHEWTSDPGPHKQGPAWHTGTNCIGKTASFQATLFADGRIKMQYKSVDAYDSPAWAPVSIGLESADGFGERAPLHRHRHERKSLRHASA